MTKLPNYGMLRNFLRANINFVEKFIVKIKADILRTLFSQSSIRFTHVGRNGTLRRQSQDVEELARSILTKQRLLSGFISFAYFRRKVSLLATQERTDQTCRLRV